MLLVGGGFFLQSDVYWWNTKVHESSENLFYIICRLLIETYRGVFITNWPWSMYPHLRSLAFIYFAAVFRINLDPGIIWKWSRHDNWHVVTKQLGLCQLRQWIKSLQCLTLLAFITFIGQYSSVLRYEEQRKSCLQIYLFSLAIKLLEEIKHSIWLYCLSSRQQFSI